METGLLNDKQTHNKFSKITIFATLYVVFIVACISIVGIAYSVHTVYQENELPTKQMTNKITNAINGTCTTDEECGYGLCDFVRFKCTCDDKYVHVDGWNNTIYCNYKTKSKVTGFILSLLLGELGIDWFYVSCGKAGYIIGGIFKLLTVGGFGIWWLVDWIRMVAGGFRDGNGILPTGM